MAQELVSGRIRKAIREALVGRTLGEIGDLFEGEQFSADLNFDPHVGGQRRTYVEQFYVLIDWAQWDHVRRYLRVVEGVLDEYRRQEIVDPMYAEAIVESRKQLEQLLRRDGFEIDDSGAIRAKWEVITQQTVQDLPSESAIPDHLKRMWDNVENRPEQAISAAKDAIESTAKHALGVLNVTLTSIIRPTSGERLRAPRVGSLTC